VAEPRGARDNAGEMADVDRRQQRGNEPFSVSSSITGTP
jgi:hypothetical protein